MRVSIISGDQPRHIQFINMVESKFSDTLVVMEQKSPPAKDLLFIKEEKYFPNKKYYGKSVLCKNANDSYVQDRIDKYKPDIMFIFGCSLLKRSLFEIPKKGCINIHTGLVQHLRGVDSCFWAIVDEKPYAIGATVHYVDSSIDGGYVICQGKPNLSEEDSFSDLFMKSCKCGFDILEENLYNICNSELRKRYLTLGTLYQNKDLTDNKICLGQSKIKSILTRYLKNG